MRLRADHVKPTDRYAHEMDAAAYWRQFQVSVVFTEPTEIKGVITDLLTETRQGVAYPRLKIRVEDGTVVVVVAYQARLLAQLMELKPVVGDLIKIIYHGEAEKAAQGMSPAKQFTVALRRPRPPEEQEAAG